MCAEASTILRAVAADFFFNCWYLEIPSGNHIRHMGREDERWKLQGYKEFLHCFLAISYPVLQLADQRTFVFV
jgi:hypothetical protein